MNAKKICKNGALGAGKTYIRFFSAKTLSIEAFWGRFSTENCAKESRHHGANDKRMEGEYVLCQAGEHPI